MMTILRLLSALTSATDGGINWLQKNPELVKQKDEADRKTREWAAQPGRRTVQAVLEDALGRVLRLPPLDEVPADHGAEGLPTCIAGKRLDVARGNGGLRHVRCLRHMHAFTVEPRTAAGAGPHRFAVNRRARYAKSARSFRPSSYSA